MKGKVLRVLPSGRWVPRNQGWLNFWETKLVTVRKSLHRSCWTELTCQGNLLPLDRVTDSRRESSREQGSTHKRKQDLSSMDSFIPSYRFTRTKEMKIAGIKISSQPCQPIIWWSALREVQISLPKSSVSTRWIVGTTAWMVGRIETWGLLYTWTES